MRNILGLAVLLLAGLSIAWHPQNRVAKPLTLPKSGEIDLIIAKGHGETREGTNVVIKDAKTIERLLAFLKVRNDKWETPWYTFPGPQWTIGLQKGKEFLLALWVGPNWLGGCDKDGGNHRLRPLSKMDRSELLEILGLEKQ